MASPELDHELVVVAVDGSDASKAALSWAVRYGRKTGATVRAVTAWRTKPYGTGFVTPDESYEKEARANLDAAVKSVRSNESDYPVETRAEHGEPTTILVEQAQQAGLLVFGDKGYGPVAGMVAGSLITRTMHHAPCPVLVVGQRMGPEPR